MNRYSLPILPLAFGLLSLSLSAGAASDDIPPPANPAVASGTTALTEVDLIRNEFDMDLAPIGVHTQVLPLYQGRYAIHLDGAVSQIKRPQVLKLAAAAAARLNAVHPGVIVLPIRESITDLTGDPDPTVNPGGDLSAAFTPLASKGVTLTVRRVLAADETNGGKKDLAILLSGTFPSLDDLHDAIQTARDCQKGLPPALAARLAYVGTEGLTMADTDLQDSWPVTSLGKAGGADGKNLNSIDSFLEVVNAVYGGPSKRVLAHRDATTIYLSGPRKTVLRIKAALGLLDAPASQARLELWPVQITSDRSRASDSASANQFRAINDDIQDTQDNMALVHEALLAVMRDQYPLSNSSQHTAFTDAGLALDKRLCSYMFQLTKAQLEDEIRANAFVNRPFTTNEMLILIGVARNRAAMILSAQQKLKVLTEASTPRSPLGAGQEMPGSPNMTAPLASLAKTYRREGILADRKAVEDFLDSVDNYRALVRALGVYGAPQGTGHKAKDGTENFDYDCPELTLAIVPRASEEMQRASGPVDGLLEAMVTGFQRDMEQMYLVPLLGRIQNGEGQALPGDGGVSLIGRTTLVVSNRLQASLKPTLVSYVDSTRPAPFGTDLLSLLAPSGAGGDKTTRTTTTDKSGNTTVTEDTTHSTDTTNLSGAAKLLAGLPTAQAALLSGAFLNGVPPAYTKVAPGVSVSVLPSVSNDGSWADLDLTTDFGVTTSAASDQARTDVWPSALPSGITSNQVITHATVIGSKLFAVSSFSLTTLAPQAPEYIPILGRLPLLGPIFQRPRGPKATRYQDLLLVNAVVVPRALGLVGLYSLNKPLPYPRIVAPSTSPAFGENLPLKQTAP